MQYIISVILFLALSNSVLAQNGPDLSKNNSIFLDLGINSFHMKDQVVSPFIYSDIIYSANIGYNYSSEKSLHNVELNYSMGRINSLIVNRIVRQYYLDFSYSMVFPIKKFKIFTFPSELFIGPGFTSSSSLAEFKYFDYKGSDAEYSWHWSRSADLVVIENFVLKRENLISLKLVFPTILLISRPNYSPGYEPNEVSPVILKAVSMGHFGYFWDNFLLFGSLNYESKLWQNICFNFGYKFNFVSIDRPRNLGMYMNNIHIGIKWHF